MTEEVVVSYLVCIRCKEQGCHIENNQGQGVISRRRLEQLNWCGCQKEKEEEMVQPRETKAQQSDAQSREPKGTAKEGGNQREIGRTFGMLREVWLNIGVEKIDTHE